MIAKKLLITTAQRGGKPNLNFLKSLEHYSKNNNAEIVILPTNGMFPSSTKQDQEEVLDSHFNNYRILEHDEKINSNIDIRYFPVKAQQIDPLTSWDRFVKQSSAIMPSPKQRLRVVPTSNQKYPKILMSTGAVTEPHYKDNSWGMKARLDHVYGAVIVDAVDNHNYHFRQLRANNSGTFYDLGIKYNEHGKHTSEPLEALVMGDYHTHQIDKNVLKGTYKLIEETKPKLIVLHDFFDGYSINHHDESMLVRRTQKQGESVTLKKELYECGEHLKRLKDYSGAKIIIVKSNHDEVIDRYLEEGRFVNDPQNIDIALLMFQAKRRGDDPLQTGIDETYGVVDGVQFLSRDDDYKILGWQLANHGDLGANGAKAGVRSLENSCNKAIYGHSHSPQIMRDVFIVGTSTPLKLDYNRGASSWMNTHALLHPNGQPQLINIFGGKYK